MFPSGSRKSQQPVYTAQSLWAALQGAEKAAGIAHSDRRAAHGLRRMLFNDVMEATGNPGTAMAAIGDTDLRVASRYLKTRDDRLVKAFEAMDRKSTETAPEGTLPEAVKPETATPQGDSRPVYHAPRRNRTYNLPVEGEGHDSPNLGETPGYPVKSLLDSPEPAPKSDPKQHPNSTDDLSRETQVSQ